MYLVLRKRMAEEATSSWIPCREFLPPPSNKIDRMDQPVPDQFRLLSACFAAFTGAFPSWGSGIDGKFQSNSR